jgi:hypothetical protein
VPTASPVQSAQAPPLEPQAVCDAPPTHMPPVEQQPPLQVVWLASPHAFSH